MRPTWERDPHTRLDLVERLKGLPDGITIRIVRLAPGLDYDVTVIAPHTAPMPAGAGDHAQPAGMNLVSHHAAGTLGEAESWAENMAGILTGSGTGENIGR